ncbi:hypothetical protein K7W42_05550 [Deinococcus sp. HMF7604]|uniref:hypothetical protein n=1 Tax=Deinococcus betulae TaxID=2873312 RepID=UPI001CCEA9C2|nr:hypothetical protein [Deinococcus betulae]MBZ9750327.1 hypothetical protein [Deinococcus betulae]
MTVQTPRRYDLALDLACQTIGACLDRARLAAPERTRLHAALQDLRRTWGTPAPLEPLLQTLGLALAELPDDCALPARVSLHTIRQWRCEVQEPGALGAVGWPSGLVSAAS